MSTFIVRVEMHEPFTDYPFLHSQMEAAGFQRQIRSDEGVMFQLPAGEYVFTSTQKVGAIDVREYTRTVVSQLSKNNWILVSKFDEAAWYLYPASSGLSGLLALSA